jgi:alkylation response protein AidB-like acyl-CoA dehydrogenase
MDFALSNEQMAIQQLARDFAREEVAPRAKEIDATDTFPWDLHRKLGELGLLSMTLPPEYGGGGADTISWSLVIEELAKVSAAVADALMLTKLMADMLLLAGTEQQKAEIPALAKGEKICAFALTEPSAGSDAASIQTTATAKDGYYYLNGQKMFITCGAIAEMFIVLVSTDKSLKSKGISAFLVYEGMEGFRRGKKIDLLGVRGLETAPLFFEQCPVPKENLLGKEGEAFKLTMRSLDSGRIGIASIALGVAQGAMEASLSYAKERIQFDQPIANFQGVQFMLADMSTEIDAARLLIHKAAYLRDQGVRFSKEAAHAKLFASDVCMKHVTNAMQIFGGYSYTKDFPIERFYRDAKIHQIWEGTNQIQRIVIARQLLK